MQLHSIDYSQFPETKRHWHINNFTFESINLLVGKNASGKSKTLNVINGLSVMLGDNRPLEFEQGNYDVTFKKDNDTYQYIFTFLNNIVTKEVLLFNGEELLSRDETGKGRIKSSHDSFHEFEIPLNELKAKRRDRSNYPYLDDLYFWANHVRHFNFSSTMGKSAFAIKDPTKAPTGFDLKNTEVVIPTFNSGKEKHPDIFVEKIIADFNSIGYNIEDIDVGSLASLNLQIIENPNAEIRAMRVKERDLACWTDQWDMSNGMFRALSVIISFNYYELENIPGMILIDDIGEGLDFERSSKLIELLISKAETNSNIQIIMSTNDSFIMNNVELKYWQIIDREGGEVKYYNHTNSQQIFDDYKFTGLNHFDFFATEFFKNGFSNENEN